MIDCGYILSSRGDFSDGNVRKWHHALVYMYRCLQLSKQRGPVEQTVRNQETQTGNVGLQQCRAWIFTDVYYLFVPLLDGYLYIPELSNRAGQRGQFFSYVRAEFKRGIVSTLPPNLLSKWWTASSCCRDDQKPAGGQVFYPSKQKQQFCLQEKENMKCKHEAKESLY